MILKMSFEEIEFLAKTGDADCKIVIPLGMLLRID